ncbi:MAG: hypothetical protein LUD46_14110 [Parabacteroides sp.]|nr:hypothetical protein [Parabacteroides sp.]
MYTSGTGSNTPPPIASNDYEAVVAEYNRQYIAPELCEEMTRLLSIAHVDPILREHGEYIVYGTMIENGVNREKKMRFSYFDKEKNIWLMTRTDITEIKEERRQKLLLQEALQSATAANRAKSDFLSRMSHDVRTPINAIIGMTAIAGLHMDDQNRIADCLKKDNHLVQTPVEPDQRSARYVETGKRQDHADGRDIQTRRTAREFVRHGTTIL